MLEQKISLEDLDSGQNLSDNAKTIFSLDKFNKTILNTCLELLVLRLSNDKWYKDTMQKWYKDTMQKWYKDTMQILVSVQICKIALLGQITWTK